MLLEYFLQNENTFMLILGVDPGTATTGYGVIRVVKNGYEVLDFELVQTDKNDNPSVRYKHIYGEFLRLIDKYKPDVMVIEKVFFATNAKTAIRVGQAQGVMLLAAAHKDLEVVEYAPGTIKKQISGNGRASKIEMQEAIRKHLGSHIKSEKGKKTHFDNAADALAIALCHAFHLNI